MHRKVNLKGENGIHPSVDRAVEIIKENFQKLCLVDQDILGKDSFFVVGESELLLLTCFVHLLWVDNLSTS